MDIIDKINELESVLYENKFEFDYDEIESNDFRLYKLVDKKGNIIIVQLVIFSDYLLIDMFYQKNNNLDRIINVPISILDKEIMTKIIEYVIDEKYNDWWKDDTSSRV
jgi:hypothetical protein